MKIDGKVTSPLAGEITGDRKANPAGGAPARDQAPLLDQPAAESADVHVSDLAVNLRRIGTELRTGDEVDAAKVAEARQAIAQGRLQIEPDAIAERLLELVREVVREDPASKP